jgi:hypothetical protein
MAPSVLLQTPGIGELQALLKMQKSVADCNRDNADRKSKPIAERQPALSSESELFGPWNATPGDVICPLIFLKAVNPNCAQRDILCYRHETRPIYQVPMRHLCKERR